MKTLFIEFHYLKGNQGAIYAARTHVNLFAELSEEMTLIYPSKKDKEPEGIYKGEKMKMIPVVDKRSKLSKFIGLCFGKMHRFSINDEYLNPNKYDVVVFDTSDVSARLIKKFKKAGIRIITIHHNYQIELLKGDCNKLLLGQSLFWTNIYERQAVKYSDLNLTLTTQDSELLRKNYCKEANFATIGVFDYLRREYPQILKEQRHHHYLITGGLAAKQNEDSLLPWLEEFLPLLKETDPKAQLTIAGRSPSSKLIKKARDKGTEIIPSPKDMAPILLNGDYYICPTDRGGGLKLRIMDGLKYGMPVLTHKVSARGYESMIKAGVVFVYNDPESFVRSVSNMINVKRSSIFIQSLYIENYSFDTGVKRLKKILIENHFLSK